MPIHQLCGAGAPACRQGVKRRLLYVWQTCRALQAQQQRLAARLQGSALDRCQGTC